MSTKPLACKNTLGADHAELYDILIAHLSESVVFLMDKDGCICSWNPGVERILGYSQSEWLEQSGEIIATLEDEIAGAFHQDLVTVTRLGQIAYKRWRVRKDGSRIFVKDALIALRDPAGELLGFSEVMHDLSENHRREEALRQALEYAESVVDAVRQPVLVLDGLTIRSANIAFYRTFGLTNDQTEGLRIYDLKAGAWDIPQLHVLLDSDLSSQPIVRNYEIEHTFPELGRKILLLDARKIAETSTGHGLTVLAIEDLTVARQAEKALADSEKQRRLIMDAVPAMMSYIDRDLRFRMVNSTYQRWFGIQPSDLIGKRMEELYGQKLLEAVQPRLDQAFSGEAVSFEQDYPTLKGERTLQMTYTPDWDPVEGVKGLVVLGNDISGRKKTEIALRASEERWRSLFDRMAEGFFVAEIIRPSFSQRADFKFLEVNPAFEQITGLSNVTGKTFREAIPGIEDTLIQRYVDVVDSGEPTHFEVLIPALQNAWYEVRAYRAEPDCVAVIFLDATERKAFEVQLRENAQRQAALVVLGDRLRDSQEIPELISAAMEIVGNTLGVARVGYGRVDHSAEFITIENDWTNGRVPSLAGTYRFEDYGPELSAILQRGDSLLAPDVTTHPITSRESARWKALQIGSVVNLPLLENGRLVAVLFVQDSVPRQWSELDLTFLHKVADRTWAAAERTRAIRELQESEAFTRSVLDSSPDCIKILDMQGQMLSINQGGCSQMEIDDVSTCLNRPWLEFWDHSSELATDALTKALSGYTQRFEAFCPTAKGTPKWWEVVVSPIRGVSGAPVRILSLSRDITQRKVAEGERERLTVELQRSNEDLSQFAHTVAHDLQTPLRGVMVFAQLLQRQSSERLTGKDAEFLEHIVLSARRMAELVQGLLRFAQVGQGQIERKPVAMETTLDSALQSLQSQIDEKAAVINHRALPTVCGDAVQLSQLLQNLVGNALKYHRTGVPPEVSISAVRDGTNCRFAVCDNGEGIAPEHLRTVFEPLKRFHGGDIQGSGLGLAVCERIISRHGGRIWVESSLDRGSCFYFTLPAA